MPFTPSKELTDTHVRVALADRAKMADEFIEPARLGYVRLKPAPEIATASEGIGDRNLVDDPARETQESP